MVYRTGLENRSPCKRTVGSNPTPSASRGKQRPESNTETVAHCARLAHLRGERPDRKVGRIAGGDGHAAAACAAG